MTPEEDQFWRIVIGGFAMGLIVTIKPLLQQAISRWRERRAERRRQRQKAF